MMCTWIFGHCYLYIYFHRSLCFVTYFETIVTWERLEFSQTQNSWKMLTYQVLESFFLEYCIASVNEIFGICISSQSFSLGKLET